MTEITDDELQFLRGHSGIELHSEQPPASTQIDPDSDEELTFPWRSDDGRIQVTLEQCNAIRCAAHDGLAYSRIAELYSFVSGKRHAQSHATGECSHTDGVSSVVSKPNPQGEVTKRLCARLRRLWERNPDQTYRELASEVGLAYGPVWNHVNGECKHD